MKETNRHILQEAIKKLPQYHPSEQQWAAILSALEKEGKDEVLTSSISQLQTYDPPKWLWDKIENHLADQESNEDKVLQNALRNLPEHEGPPMLWDNISSELAETSDQEIKLNRAIAKLPEHKAPETVWQNIEKSLRQDSSPLSEALDKMPSHSPPPQLWDNITNELDQDKNPVPIRRITILRRMVSAAAVILLLLVAGIWVSQGPETEEQFVYSEEKLESLVSYADWDRDEEAFAMVMEFCKVQALVCEEPGFKDLRSELEELNSAREKLKEALGVYGSDTHLMTQLTKVERERSDVLKQMVARI